MNWATLAPEDRLFKGKNLFRWDDSPGLEHHCGICATPLHNARAKTSCLGKHVEPCYRFHQQLHFVGKSHECFGCNSSDEMHHNRHKEILKIIRHIGVLDEASKKSVRDTITSSKSRKGSSATYTPTDTSSETFAGDYKLTRRERKKAKKAGTGPTKDRQNVEAFPQEELNFISEALHLSIHESKGAWEGTYNYDSREPAADTAEIMEEAADNEDNAMDSAQNDPFSVKCPEDMTPRQRKIFKKFTTPINHSSYGGGSRKYSPYDGKQLLEGVDAKIFFRLGVEVETSGKNTKARRDLIVELVAAVKEDLAIIAREDKESRMRAEGFWRWAGKTAYHHILRTREDLDWATGQKRGPPREEVIDNDEMDGIDNFEDLKGLAEVLPSIEGIVGPHQIGNCIVDEAKTADHDDEFEIVSARTKKPFKKKKKNGIHVKRHPSLRFAAERGLGAEKTPTIAAEPERLEHDDDDGWELVNRYKQKLRGDRNIVATQSSDGHKAGGRLVVRVK